MGSKRAPTSIPLAPSAERRAALMAVLFVDAVDYTKAMHADEDAAQRAIMSRLDLLKSRIGTYRGRVVNHTGDGIFAVFDTMDEAVRYAMEMRDALELAVAEDIGLTLPLRFGIHAGDVILDHDLVFGDCVNIAARLQAIAAPNTVAISRTVYDQIRFKLDFDYEYLGPQALKNLPEPLEAFRVGPRREAGLAHASVRARAERDPLWQELFQRPSVAVLPFKNRSQDAGQDYFADGLTEDIITNLSRFRALSVIARGSVFVFKGQQLPVQDYAKRLGVRYVVQGSVQRSGTRVRVNVELSDTVEGKELWSERYDRNAEDLFEIQDDITTVATGAMAVQIESAERERIKTIAPPSLAAYGLVLQGQSRLFRYTQSDNQHARDFYVRGLDHSRRYARAMAALSRTHNLDWRYAWSTAPEESLELAQQWAVGAVEADPSDARGHAELGYVRLYRKQHDPAIEAYKRAVGLNPSDANILMEYGDTLAHAGRPQEAIALLQQAMRLNPYYPDEYLWALAGSYFKLTQYEDAIQSIYRMTNAAQGYRIVTASLALLGRTDEARAHADHVRATQPDFDVAKWASVVPDKRPEDIQRFIDGLRIAGL